ncbi:hypothetical protein ACLBWS_14590 [Brucellaceae bacterium D45D]
MKKYIIIAGIAAVMTSATAAGALACMKQAGSTAQNCSTYCIPVFKYAGKEPYERCYLDQGTPPS